MTNFLISEISNVEFLASNISHQLYCDKGFSMFLRSKSVSFGDRMIRSNFYSIVSSLVKTFPAASNPCPTAPAVPHPVQEI